MPTYTVNTFDVCTYGSERLRNQDEFILCASVWPDMTRDDLIEQFHADIQSCMRENDFDYGQARTVVSEYVARVDMKRTLLYVEPTEDGEEVVPPSCTSARTMKARRTTMEIDITRFFNGAEPFEFSASVAERGTNAGRETWANAVREGGNDPLLTSPDQLEALRDYAKGFGAWSDEEIAGWSDAQCNALFIQLISGDIRQLEDMCMNDAGKIDWEEAERLASAGTIGGNLYHGTDDRVYYYLGS